MSLRSILPGLALAVGAGALALLLGPLVPDLGAVAVALLLGMAIAVGGAVRPASRPGVTFAGKQVLETAVVLLGLRLDPWSVAALGPRAVLAVAGAVLTALLGGLLLSRLLRLPRSLGALIGVGAAICGTSAIAAAAPLVAKDRDDVVLSVGAVNLVGIAGLFLLPLAATALALPEGTAALLIGGTLPAVGHVVAAGFAVGDAVGELATAIKMGRVALLVPLVLALGLLRGRGEGLTVPPYLLAFLALVLLRGTGVVPDAVVAGAEVVSDVLLAVAMAALGMQIRPGSVVRRGPRALLAGAILFALQLTVLLALA